MNKKRRKKIRDVTSQLNECLSTLEWIKDDEDEARDSTPESLQGTQSYQNSEECSEVMEDAMSDIQDAVDKLENII